MKILFLISNMGHGMGGHFHSLDHISRQIAKSVNAKIISIGPGNSSVIRNNPLFAAHFNFSGLNFVSLRKKLKQFIDQYNPDVLHFFDDSSYNIVRTLLAVKKYKVIVNKCGGPNPKRYPHIENLVLFSIENLEWFKKQRKFQNKNIYLIPNRVEALLPEKAFQPIPKPTDEFVFMRICRIGAGYKKSIMDAINLIEVLAARNISNVKLYIIGVVEDTSLHRLLESHPLVKKKLLVVLSDNLYTNNASKMLYLADAVIGTGRGLMEAASLAMPILAINSVGTLPVLLTRDNFFDAFKTNFSERNIFTDTNHDVNLQKIEELVQSIDCNAEISKFSKEVFDKYFNIDKAEDAYSNVYSKAINGGNSLLIDAPLILRSFLNTFFHYLKAKRK